MSGAYDKKRRSRYGDRPVRTGMGNSSEKGDYEQEILEGRNPVLEALRSGRSINKIFVAKGEKEGSINQIIAIARDNKIVVQDVERSKLDGMSETHVHQGVIAFVSAKEYVSVEDILNAAEESGQPPMVIVLDEIADPHNLGSILRSANAAGAHGIIIPKRRAVGLTATVSKASAGAIEYLPVARVTNIAQTLKLLKEKGLWVVGTDSNGEMPYFDYDYKGAVAIVVGSEGAGIRRLVREECDTIVSIPMRGQINSLNASVAAAEGNENVRERSSGILGIIGRIIAAAIVLVITQAVTPGFSISNIWALILAAVVLAILDYVASRMLNVDASPFGRGLTGFIAAAVIIYVIKFIVPGYQVTLLGAILGALVYGLVDMIIPGRSM
jgi:23S rRNA (guanosine2251-2'-O)-methyltransferase